MAGLHARRHRERCPARALSGSMLGGGLEPRTQPVLAPTCSEVGSDVKARCVSRVGSEVGVLRYRSAREVWPRN